MEPCDWKRKGNLCRTSDGGSKRRVKPNGAASGCCYDVVSPNPISDTAMEYYEKLGEKLGEGVKDWRNYAARADAVSSKPIPQTESDPEILGGEFVTCLDRLVRFWRLAVAMELLMIKYAVISYEIQNKNKRCEHDASVQLIRRPIANRQRSFKLSDQRLRRPIASNQDWELLKTQEQQLMMMMDDS